MPLSQEEFIALPTEERAKVLKQIKLEKDFKALPSEDRAKVLGLLKAKKESEMTQTEAGARGLMQGASYGFADEAIAGLTSLGKKFVQKVASFDEERSKVVPEQPLAQIYSDELRSLRSRDALAEEKFPKTFGTGEVVGAVGTTLIPIAGQAGKAFTFGQQAVRGATGAAKAALGSGLTAVGKSEDKSIEDFKTGATIGGTVGGAASLAGPLGRGLAKMAVKSPGTVSAIATGGKSAAMGMVFSKLKNFVSKDDAIGQKLDSIAKAVEVPRTKLTKAAVGFIDTLGEAFEKQGAAGLVSTHAVLLKDPKYIKFLDEVETKKESK